MAIQHRRGTPEEWADYNEVLKDGQLGISWSRDIDENPTIKVGNGENTFSELPEVSGAGGSSILVKDTVPSNSEGKDGDLCFVVGG